MRHNTSVRAALAGLAAATTALLAVSCRPAARPPEERPPAHGATVTDVRAVFRGLSDEEAAAYTGDRVCASCHREEYDRSTASRHARTLQAVVTAEHARYFQQHAAIRDPLADCTYDVAVQKGVCVMGGTVGGKRRTLPADFVFGSGRNAHTYMSRITDDTWIDLRISYYTSIGRWDFTPMQKPGDRPFPLKAGIEQSGERLVRCILCHATVLRVSSTGVDIDRSEIGVRCERCHGPGRKHVEWARSRATARADDEVHLERLSRASPDRIQAVCGGCHRTPETARPGDPVTENGLARFQGAALARSKCFQKSGSLSCITCHDPHGDSDPDPARNDARCLRCHSGAASKPRDSRGGLCPVNPREGCVRCHMPAQSIKTIPHARYHNHWIKVWKEPQTAHTAK